MIYRNVVIGQPIVEPWELIAVDPNDWENNEKKYTLFTNSRYLPAVLKEAGLVSSIRELRRNRPELCRTFTDDELDCLDIKIGKKRLWIVVGAGSEDIPKKKLDEIDVACAKRTVKDVFQEFTSAEKEMTYYMVGQVIDFGGVAFDNMDADMYATYRGLSSEKRKVVSAIIDATH